MDARPTTPLWFQRVQAILDERGWTQRRLAALAIVKHPDCGVTEPRLSKWRAGLGSIYLSQIEAIADALEVDVGDLVGQKRAIRKIVLEDVFDIRPLIRIIVLD